MASSAAVNKAPTITTTQVPSGEQQPSVRAVSSGQFVTPAASAAPTVRPALKPKSIETEPWVGFGKYDTRIFKDDFCHEKHFTGKVKAASVDGATFNLKEVANLEKDNALKIKDELKLWFPINYGPQFLHLRIKDTDTRVHYDNGVTELGSNKVNFYSSFGWARDFHNYNFKLGSTTFFGKNSIDTRARITSDRNVAIYQKGLFEHKDLRFGFIGVLDITRQLLLRKDLLLGYRKKEWDFIFKAEQAFDRETKNYKNIAEWFSNISLTALYTHDSKLKVAAQVESDPVKQSVLGTALVEYKFSEKGIAKVALNSAATLSVMAKRTINNLWSLSIGGQVPLSGDKGAKNKFGLQVDLNL